MLIINQVMHSHFQRDALRGGDNYFFRVSSKFVQGLTNCNGIQISEDPRPSIAINLNISFVSRRNRVFFVDGHISNGQLNLTVARSFFQNLMDSFANKYIGLTEINDPITNVFSAHPISKSSTRLWLVLRILGILGL